jgi:hypothetical protein
VTHCRIVLHCCRQAEDGAPCARHPDQSSGCPLPDSVDVLFGSGPCQPYSQLRRSGNATKVTAHDGYHATFGSDGSIISVCRRVLPRIFLTEQVLGFGTPYTKGVPDITPKSEFVSEVMGIVNGSGNHHFAKCICVQLDSGDFLTCGRPRSLGCFDCLEHSLPEFYISRWHQSLQLAIRRSTHTVRVCVFDCHFGVRVSHVQQVWVKVVLHVHR